MLGKKKKKNTFVPEILKRHSDASPSHLFFDGCIVGEMLEWLKRHAWKACIRQKCIAGSNPALSAVIK